MSTRSGRLGVVDGISTVLNWKTSEKSDNQAYTASNTQGGTGRLPGNTDWNGSFDFLGHTPPVIPGNTFSFVGYDGNQTASGTGIVDAAGITIDVEGGKIIQGSLSFSANGPLVLGAGSATDVTIPDPPSAIGCKALWNAAELLDIAKMVLNLKATNPSYNSSTTGGATARRQGNFDFDGTIDLKINTLAGLPTKGDIQILKLYVGASTFWELKWAIIDEVATSVDVNTQAINAATIRFSKAGFKSGAVGYVKTPSVTTIWP